MTCGTQVMFGDEVHANQNSPTGRMTEPSIMGGRRSSGMTLPCFLSLRAKRVFVIILYGISVNNLYTLMLIVYLRDGEGTD